MHFTGEKLILDDISKNDKWHSSGSILFSYLKVLAFNNIYSFNNKVPWLPITSCHKEWISKQLIYVSNLPGRILVGVSNKVLVNSSQCGMSTVTAFQSCVPRAWLWFPFQNVVEIVYNLSIFILHQKIWYADGTVFHCFILHLMYKEIMNWKFR